MTTVLAAHAAGSPSLRRALAAIDLRRWDDAVRYAVDALAQEPQNARAYAALSHALLGVGDFARAAQVALDGLGREPGSEWLHRLRSIALRNLGRCDEALAAAVESLRLAPQNAAGHAVHARALLACKRPQDAAAAAERALALDADNPEYHALLGDVWLPHDRKRAASHYRAALSRRPNDAVVLNNLGVALLRDGRRVDAALTFKAAVLVDPTMKIAKRNIHVSVRSASAVGVAAWLIWLVANTASRLPVARRSPSEHTLVLVVGAVAVVGLIAWRLLLPWWNLRAMRKADPELVALYEQIVKDRRAGRL